MNLTPGRALLLSRTVQLTRPAGAPYTGPSAGVMALWGVASAASMAASAYHGVKRNRGSAGWGVAWGLSGALFPVITPAIAIAQGFAKPA